MRIIGFSIEWPKLEQDEFTTFRFQRKDRDWSIGEAVQVRIKPRSKGGGIRKGVAVIMHKENKGIADSVAIKNTEAVADGFPGGVPEMWRWFIKSHSPEQLAQPLYKLTLKWANTILANKHR